MEGMEGMEAVAHNQRSNSEAVAHKTPALQQQRDRAQKRGFSLIEAAIVLGVVGAVIGGIWYSAAAVSDKWQAERLATGIMSMVDGTRKLFPMNLWPTEVENGQTYIETTAIAAGIVPADLIKGNTIINTMENNIHLSLRLIYPPLIPERYIYFFTPSTSETKANAFLVSFLSPLRNTKNQVYRCYCSNGVSIWNYYSADNWPPSCPPLDVSGYIAIACYMYP